MDILGKVARAHLKQIHENNVKQAYVLAMDFKREGMSTEEVEEMLFSAGYESPVVDSAMNRLLGKPEA